MQSASRKPQFASRPANSTANVTSAIGMEETVGRLRARRNSFFTQTVIWVTAFICVVFLFGSLAQAWANSQLMQQTRNEQKKLQQMQEQHASLVQTADHYGKPAVVESEARQQLGYVRPDEQSVVIIGSNDQRQQHTQSHTQSTSQQGFWQEWWKTFFGE